MSFRVLGLDPAPFLHLYGQTAERLAECGVRRIRVDATPGFPDRVELRDLEQGDSALLLNFLHQPADSPYKSSHAIFIREGAMTRFDAIDRIPDVMRIRVISLRAFSAGGEMVDADLAGGASIEPLIVRYLARPDVDYLHVHYAKRGCYAGRIERI